MSPQSSRCSKFIAARRSGYDRWDKEYIRLVNRFWTFLWHLCARVNMVPKHLTHIQELVARTLQMLALVYVDYAKQSPWICVKCLVAIFTKAHKCHWKSPKAIHQTYTTFVSPIISRTSCSNKLGASWTSSAQKWSSYV